MKKVVQLLAVLLALLVHQCVYAKPVLHETLETRFGELVIMSADENYLIGDIRFTRYDAENTRFKRTTLRNTRLKEVNDSRIYFLSKLAYKDSDVVLFSLDRVFSPKALSRCGLVVITNETAKVLDIAGCVHHREYTPKLIKSLIDKQGELTAFLGTYQGKKHTLVYDGVLAKVKVEP